MRKIKSFNLFESFDDALDIVTVVKEMLLEFDFLDIEKRVDIVKNHSKLQVQSNPEIIVINLWKKAVSFEWSRGIRTFKPSYHWNDIKDVIIPIIEYLDSEGFEWHKNAGTGAYNDCPIISTSGKTLSVSQDFDTVRSKVEMWFIR